MTQPTSLQVQLLSRLLDNPMTVRTELHPKKHKKIRLFDARTNESYEVQTYVDRPVKVPVPTFAGNVSQENVEILAKRWLP